LQKLRLPNKKNPCISGNIGIKKGIGEMQDFMAKLPKKVWFPGLIFKYTEKIRFQHLKFYTPIFKKWQMFVFFG